jgi:hypothetical protein
MDNKRAVTKTVVYGILSAGLYFLLYLFADQITELSKQGRWYFIVPMVIAFVFSIVHGNFTGYFWDLLGVKAKTKK